MPERSFFSGDDALVLALALAPALDCAFALAAADFSEPGLPERLLLLMLLPELRFPLPLPSLFTKLGPDPTPSPALPLLAADGYYGSRLP